MVLRSAAPREDHAVERILEQMPAEATHERLTVLANGPSPCSRARHEIYYERSLMTGLGNTSISVGILTSDRAPPSPPGQSGSARLRSRSAPRGGRQRARPSCPEGLSVHAPAPSPRSGSAGWPRRRSPRESVAWNDFLFALVLIGKDELKTVAIGINEFFHMAVVDWG